MEAVVASVIGPVVVLVVGWMLKRDNERRIGTPNGAGNLVEMAEKLLAGQAGQDNRLAKLERQQAETTDAVQDLRGRVSAVERAIAPTDAA